MGALGSPLEVPWNMGLHILYGHILCILLKSIQGAGTDTSLEKRALRTWRYPHGSSVTQCAQHMHGGELFCMCASLVQNWGGPRCLGLRRLCSPHQQDVLLLVTSQTNQRQLTLLSLPRHSLDPANAFLVPFVPFLTPLSSALLCCLLILGFFPTWCCFWEWVCLIVSLQEDQLTHVLLSATA